MLLFQRCSLRHSSLFLTFRQSLRLSKGLNNKMPIAQQVLTMQITVNTLANINTTHNLSCELLKIKYFLFLLFLLMNLILKY